MKEFVLHAFPPPPRSTYHFPELFNHRLRMLFLPPFSQTDGRSCIPFPPDAPINRKLNLPLLGSKLSTPHAFSFLCPKTALKWNLSPYTNPLLTFREELRIPRFFSPCSETPISIVPLAHPSVHVFDHTPLSSLHRDAHPGKVRNRCHPFPSRRSFSFPSPPPIKYGFLTITLPPRFSN